MLKGFLDARKKIAKKNLKSVYFLWGDEDFFKDTLVDQIINLCSDYDLVRFFPNTPYVQVLDALDEDDFFNRQQLIIINDFDKADYRDKIIKQISKKTFDDVLLVLKSEKSFKPLLENSNVFSFESKKLKLYDESVPNFITAIVKGTGYSIDDSATKFLISICKNDLSALVNELRKVFCIKEKGSLIKIADLKDIVYIGHKDDIFELTELLAKKDLKAILHLMSDLAVTEDGVIGTTIYLFKHFKKLCTIVDMLKNDFTHGEISSHLKLPYFVVKELEKQANKITMKKLLSFFKKLCDIDLKTKSTNVDGFTLLSKFFIEACQ